MGGLKGAVDDDRAAQGNQARFLGLRIEPEVVALVRKIDGAGAENSFGFGVQDQRCGGHDAVLGVEVTRPPPTPKSSGCSLSTPPWRSSVEFTLSSGKSVVMNRFPLRRTLASTARSRSRS